MKLKYFWLLITLFIPYLVFAQDTKKDEATNNEASRKDNSATTGSKSVEEIKSQIKSLGKKWNCNTDYDRFADESYSVCFFDLVGFGEGFGKIFSGGLSGKTPAEPPSFVINIGFGFKGDKFTQDINNFIIIVETTDTEWKLLKNSAFYAIADSERFNFGDGKLIDSDFTVEPGYKGLRVGTSETVSFKVTREELRKLADAKLTEIRIGTREQKLKKKQQDIIKSILALAVVSEKAESKKK